MDNGDSVTNPWIEYVNMRVPHFYESWDEGNELAAGQVWRARWDDVVSMVFVDKRIGSFRNLVRVAPVTVGQDMADNMTVILPAGSTSLSVALSVWTELATDVAEVVLERLISNAGQYGSLAALLEASDAGALARGLPVLNLSSRRAQTRRELALVMEALSNAVNLISGNGALPDMIAAANLTVKAIAEVLRVNPAAALKLANGTGLVGVVQARALSPLMDVEVGVILASNPVIEEGLTAAVTRLSVRPRLASLEAADSEALLELTQGALALAARKEGDLSVWDARVDLYFEMRFGERS
ncbi:MAG: hypothetical protein JWP19_2201 [Rhodoglobus sp.]|nr:hypothetical protein [Rhodoglobus sp.]